MITESLRVVKDRFSEYVGLVDREHERVVVTRNGRPAAVLVSPDDLEALEETVRLLEDRSAMAELDEAEQAVARRRRRSRRRRGPAPPSDSSQLPWELVVARPAARALSDVLPEAVAVAVIGFITGHLLEAPERVGGLLRGELAGTRSARRGTYRVLYRVDERRREVVVLRVEHRRDAYRRR